MSIGMGNYGGQQGPPKEVKEAAKEHNKSVIGHTLKVIGEISGKPLTFAQPKPKPTTRQGLGF